MSFFAGKTKSPLGASSGRGGKAPKNGKNGIFSFPGKTTPRGCVKRFFTALRAKLYFDGDIFFLILRSKIRKKMSPSKENFAAAGGKRLFTQPRTYNINAKSFH